ncbi:MAG: glycosyltransferase family 2 protein [Bacilli bacterium]
MYPLVSVIIPTYNNERTIARAIHSVLKQRLYFVECIVINDGSSDTTHAIVKRIAMKNRRVRYVHQTNQGVSHARNVGLSLARGTFITFLDGDDCYDTNHFHWVYGQLLLNRGDAFIGNIEIVTEFERKPLSYMRQVHKNRHIQWLNPKTELHVFRSASVCNKWFHKRVVRDLAFMTEMQVGEDFIFSAQALLRAKKIMTTKRCTYQYYREEPTSLIQKRDVAFFRGVRRTVEILKTVPEIACQQEIYDYLVKQQCMFFVNSIFAKIEEIFEEDLFVIVNCGIETVQWIQTEDSVQWFKNEQKKNFLHMLRRRQLEQCIAFLQRLKCKKRAEH